MGRGKSKPKKSLTVYKVKEKTAYGYNRFFYQVFLEANNLITAFSTVPESKLKEEYAIVSARIKNIDNMLYSKTPIKFNKDDETDLAEERYLLTQYKCDLYNATIKKRRASLASCNQKLLDNWYLTDELFGTLGKSGRFTVIKGRCV